MSRIADDIQNLGVTEGDTILVHSSFKSLGHVPGGIETLILGLLQAIGETGTLLLPALCWNLRPPTAFDVRTTPGIVGAVPEYFRTRPGTLRSVHPTHSVCAVGKDAHALLDDHVLDSTPCGPNSPFCKITDLPAKIVMLGCGLRPNTTMHALEERIDHPRFLGEPLEFTITDREGNTYRKAYRTHAFNDYRQRYDRVLDHYGDASFIHRGHVLDAEAFVLQSMGLRDAVLETLEEDPLAFVAPVATSGV